MIVKYSLAIITGCLSATTFSICLIFVLPTRGADTILISALTLCFVWVPLGLYFSTLTLKQNAVICAFLTLSIFLAFSSI